MNEIKKISIEDENYPRLLRKLKNAPKIIYYRGKILAEENCFAIVGTRLCSSYGKEVAMEIAGNLTEAGLTIVSGLAPGIDTVSHQTAIERSGPARNAAPARNAVSTAGWHNVAGGRTIAVLGTGVDEKSIYPKDNIKLANKIVMSGGCLISEYPPGTGGSKFTFPQRNRIISGLSLGILVIEAKLKSGALITADWAKRQGRKIFAVPGPIHSLNSKGCHQLIKKGVKLVESADDILKELKLEGRTMKPGPVETQKQEENLIINALREGALDIDNIIEKTKLSASVIASTLAILEINDKVRNLGGNIYALKR